jgi:N-terminal acetyltransferase B complex non-catalytic subunit
VNKKLTAAKVEIDTLKGERTLNDIEIKKKEKLNEILKENNDKLNVELNAKREEIKNLKEKISKISEEQLNKLGSIQEHSLVSLQIKYDNEFKEKEILKNELNIIRKNYQELKEESVKLNEKCDNYNKILIEADQTREELLNKFRNENSEKKNLESELQIFKENDSKSKNTIAQQKEEIKALKQGLNSINSNYDLLTNELDMKTEELSKLSLLCKQQQEHIDEFSKKFSTINNKSTLDNKRILERENELNTIKINYSVLVNELENTKRLFMEKSSEVQNLTSDLQVLAGENTNLINEVNRLSKENEKLMIIKNQLEKNSDLINQRHRSSEIDMKDLVQNYKEACKENERLKANLQLFIDENKEAYNYIQNVEKTLNNYQNSLNSCQLEKNDLLKKAEILEQYNNQLTEEINRLSDNLRDRDTKAEYLKMNVNADKEIAKNYEQQQIDSQKQISSLKAEKAQLVDSINNLSKNLEFYKHQANNLEQKINGLQNIIQKERIDQQQMVQNVNKYKEEASKLREENKKLAKMYTESKDLSSKLGKSKPNIVETFSSNEENNVLQGLQYELQRKLQEMENELQINANEAKTLRDENTRLKNILNGYEKDLKMSSDRASKGFSDYMSDN